MSAKLRVALLINMIAPARLPLYAGLAREFDLSIVQGGHERNRASWHALEKQIPEAAVKKAWGWQLRIPRKAAGRIIDHQYIHIRPGVLWELLRIRPHAVIANEMGFRTLMALFYGRLFRVPVWVWWGGTPHTERNIGAARMALRFAVSRSVSHWISYGKTSTDYLVHLKVPRSRIVEVQNSVDERRFAAGAPAEFNIVPRPVLLCIGQLIARKGVTLLLQAAARLQKEGEVFSLLLVGDGSDKAALQQQVLDLGLRNVHFQPSRQPQQLPGVYSSADAVIFPTLEDVWGLVANEAVLCGLPVLCSRYAGCAEELFSEESIVNPEDEEDFVAKLRRAVRGQLPPPDRSRILSTSENLKRLVRGIYSSLASGTSHYSGSGVFEGRSE